MPKGSDDEILEDMMKRLREGDLPGTRWFETEEPNLVMIKEIMRINVENSYALYKSQKRLNILTWVLIILTAVLAILTVMLIIFAP